MTDKLAVQEAALEDVRPEISEDDDLEMARTQKLPFADSTAASRRFFISAAELPIWR
jgi:hypothetical protein